MKNLHLIGLKWILWTRLEIDWNFRQREIQLNLIWEWKNWNMVITGWFMKLKATNC